MVELRHGQTVVDFQRGVWGMNYKELPRFGLCAAMAIATLSTVQRASAEQSWTWSAEVYGWLPTISGTTQSGYEADLEIDTILEDLNFTFMANIAAKRGRWSIFADAIYLDIDDSASGTLQFGPISVDDELDVGIRSFIGAAGAAYEMSSASDYSVNVLGGARYLWLETEVDVSVGPVRGGIKDTETYWDGFVGLQGRVDLNEQWYLAGYADVGAGQSDLTWQALAAVGYRFEKFDLIAGYRYLEWQFGDNEPLDKLDVYGPYIGARIRF